MAWFGLQMASKLIPDTHASVIANKHAVVLFFRGTTPSNLAEWWTDSQVCSPGNITPSNTTQNQMITRGQHVVCMRTLGNVAAPLYVVKNKRAYQ